MCTYWLANQWAGRRTQTDSRFRSLAQNWYRLWEYLVSVALPSATDTRFSSINQQMHHDGRRITQANRPGPAQMTEERIGALGLPHQGHTSCRTNGQHAA